MEFRHIIGTFAIKIHFIRVINIFRQVKEYRKINCESGLKIRILTNEIRINE
jgi:hypothetical protein